MVTKQTQKRRRLMKQVKGLWEIACIDEWGELCNYCGKMAGQIHHFHRKSMYGHLYFDIDNGVPTCQGCHMRADEPNMVDKLKDRRGEEWYQNLKEKSLHPPENFKLSPRWIKLEIERLCLNG